MKKMIKIYSNLLLAILVTTAIQVAHAGCNAPSDGQKSATGDIAFYVVDVWMDGTNQYYRGWSSYYIDAENESSLLYLCKVTVKCDGMSADTILNVDPCKEAHEAGDAPGTAHNCNPGDSATCSASLSGEVTASDSISFTVPEVPEA